MKKFSFLWSALLLMVFITTYCATKSTYVSGWLIVLTLILAAVSLWGTVMLMRLAFLEVQSLNEKQKYDLTIALHKFGYLFLLIAFGCVLFIAKHPADHHISSAIGIGCLCNFILSIALRNLLGS